jgi:hypothetical protein
MPAAVISASLVKRVISLSPSKFNIEGAGSPGAEIEAAASFSLRSRATIQGKR